MDFKMNQAELYKKYSKGQNEYGLHLMDLLNPTIGSSILDIGSGTGNLTYQLAHRVGNSGKVIAIDPDLQRMTVAKSKQPEDINNIQWYNGTLCSYPNSLSNCFNFAFSNYVFHWVPNQEQIAQKIYEALVPGGKFALSLVCGHPKVIEDLILAMGAAGDKLRSKFYYRAKDSWLDLLRSIGFEIKKVDRVDDYYFSSLKDLMIWWQATTHGLFKPEDLTQEQLNDLKNKYPSDISIYCDETLSLVMSKN
jgi:ubiquinone/menaquinone biosynthesis C-methylase UbiE